MGRGEVGGTCHGSLVGNVAQVSQQMTRVRHSVLHLPKHLSHSECGTVVVRWGDGASGTGVVGGTEW